MNKIELFIIGVGFGFSIGLMVWAIFTNPQDSWPECFGNYKEGPIAAERNCFHCVDRKECYVETPLRTPEMKELDIIAKLHCVNKASDETYERFRQRVMAVQESIKQTGRAE